MKARVAVVSALITQRGNDGQESFLLVCKQGHWIFVGGKSKDGESDLECISREAGDEVPGVTIVYQEYIGHFDGISPIDSHGFRMHLHHYLYKSGSTSVRPGCELENSGWFTFEQATELNLSEVTREALKKWKENHNE